MLKRIISVLLILFSIFQTNAYADSISAQAYVVYHPTTSQVIASKNHHKRLSMASTTKIMTGLIACSQPDINKVVTVKSEMLNVEGTSAGLQNGDKISILELCYGLLLESGNDAANILAFEIGGSIKEFAKIMNDTAAKIGMADTNFVTPSGLDASEHYTTAYDMALLAETALKNETFRKIVSSKTHKAIYNDGNTTRTYSNHNRLLSMYDGCIGVKTGFTKKSGRCLVSACNRDGVEMIVVTLNAPNDWNDHKSLYDNAYSDIKTIEYNHSLPNQIHICGGEKSNIKISTCPFSVDVPANYNGKIEAKVYLPDFLYAPVNIGDEIGRVEYFINNKKIGDFPFTAVEKSAIIKSDVNLFDVFLNNFLRLIV